MSQITILIALVLGRFAIGATTPDWFESKVRPILATQCFACHTASGLGGLRVDSREALLKGGKSGPAVVPGDPEKSLLIAAVRQTTALKMPQGGKLKKEEIDTLVEWVKGGVIWPVTATPVIRTDQGNYRTTAEQRAFWSFQPLKAVEPPAVKNGAWPRTGIDRFILARLEKEAMTPAPPTDRRTLLRRASLDLTGLPPTHEEVEAFVGDKSPTAFETAVDRLLGSPHYGERWGRMWLDVARYGEDDFRSQDPMRLGYMPYPFSYLYRDWVIRAFNEDLPYGEFVKAQIAADRMEGPRVRLLPALGFLGLGPWYYDNGAVEITRADERHDRIDVISRGFLGLTVGCARCHDHKYDPIPAADYYAMAGVFASSEYREYPQAPKAVVEEYKALEKKLKAKEDLLGEFLRTEGKQVSQALALEAEKYMQAAWRIKGEPKQELSKVVDEGKLDYELMDRWLRFLAKPPRFYPYLKDWQAMIERGGTAAEAKKLAGEFQALLLEVMFEKKEIEEENEVIGAKALEGTKKKERRNKPNEFVTNEDFCPGCGLEFKTMAVDRTSLWIDVFQRDLDGSDVTIPSRNAKPGLLSFRGWGLERQLSPERRGFVKALRDGIETARKEMPKPYPYVHGMADLEKPVDLPVSLRGNPNNPGAVTPRGFLSILAPGERLAFEKGSGRLQMAEAIVAQPLAMRVIVNRIWKGHFGTGLVDTPSNFGVTGERPSHPELLEYLAGLFLKNGMSLKKLHREILLSATYQMSAGFSQTNFDKDAGNRLHWRANRRRLDAEQIRDSMLAVSGALDKKLGGPSEPLTPEGVRRTVYAKVSRFKLDDYLQLFDFPSPNLSAEQRFTTTVPLQRLFFMNSDFVQQQAELLARRAGTEQDNRARIGKLYQLVFTRPPDAQEMEAGLEYLRGEPLKEYEERKQEAARKTKEQKPAAGMAAPPEGEMPPMDLEGMMAGVVKGAPGSQEAKKKLLPVTPLGRYAKVLLTSGEFTFLP